MLNPEGDIEDLYREFAKNYPLKTDDTGWDDFLHKLDASMPLKNMPPKQPGAWPAAGVLKQYAVYYAIAVAAVIISGVLLYKTKTQPAPAANPANTQAAQTKPQQTKTPAAQTAVAPSPATGRPKQDTAGGATNQSTAGVAQHAAGTAATPAPQKHQNLAAADASQTKNPPNGTVAGPKVSQGAQVAQPTAGGATTGVKQIATATTGGDAKGTAPTPIAGVYNNSVGKTRFDSGEATTISPAKGTGNNGDTIQPVPQSANTAINNAASSQTGASNKTTPQNDADSTAPGLVDSKPTVDTAAVVTNLAATTTPLPAVPDSAVPNTAASAQGAGIQPGKAGSNATKRYVYLGIVGGPDFSAVKFQVIKSTGFNVGMLFGAHLSKYVGVESGFLYTSKKYYSSGAYFKTQNVPLPPPDRNELLSVSGNSNFFEIPIALRFNITSKKAFDFFATGGLSSYFALREQYQFLFHRAYGNQIRVGDVNSYCSNVLSIVHLSAGIDLKLNAENVIRFEPYLKLPLSGIGVTALPVTSTGLYINITHKFF